MQCMNPINGVGTFYTYHVCGAYMNEGEKKVTHLDLYLVNFENFGLSEMAFALESSDMSFLSAQSSYSWCYKHNAQK